MKKTKPSKKNQKIVQEEKKIKITQKKKTTRTQTKVLKNENNKG